MGNVIIEMLNMPIQNVIIQEGAKKIWMLLKDVRQN